MGESTMKVQGIRSRPPADSMANEAFLDKKCGTNSSHDLFYGWCSRVPINQKVSVTCEDIRGHSGPCQMDAAFVDIANPNIDSITTYKPDPNTLNEVPSYPDKLPEYFSWRTRCSFGGPGKETRDNDTDKLFPEQADQIIVKCRQEMYGVQGMPLWLILLIIFLVLLAVTVAAGLFWKYYVKKKYYGPKRSTRTGSQWTSAPFLNQDGGSRISNLSEKRSSAVPIGSSETRLISGQPSTVPSGNSSTRAISGQSSAVPISVSSTRMNSTSKGSSLAPSAASSKAPSQASRETSRRSKTPSIRSSSAFKP